MARERSVRELRATAHHEAGHAVMALELGIPVASVDVIEVEDRVGVVMLTKKPSWFRADGLHVRSRVYAENRVMMLLAGPIAEARFVGRNNRVGASADYHLCADYALA